MALCTTSNGGRVGGEERSGILVNEGERKRGRQGGEKRKKGREHGRGGNQRKGRKHCF